MDLPALDPELLKAFVAVADQRSFTRAAPGSIARSRRSACRSSGWRTGSASRLFHRTKANVELSPAGEGLLGYARRILSLNDEAVARLREHKVEGIVRLGVMDDYGTSIVPPVLANFLASYPLDPGPDGNRADVDDAGPARRGLRSRHRHASGRSRRGRVPAARAGRVGERSPSSVEEQDPLPVALYPQGCLFRKWAMEALDKAQAALAPRLCQPRPGERWNRSRRRDLPSPW